MPMRHPPPQRRCFEKNAEAVTTDAMEMYGVVKVNGIEGKAILVTLRFGGDI